MCWRRVLWALGLVATALFAAPAALRAQGNYLDEFIVKVKPEKVADFQTIAKKIADINRRNNGDRWLTMATLYGEADTYLFASRRQDYADIEKSNDAFMNALNKTLGKEGAEKLLHDFNNCLVSVRTELRLRRPDLSSKVPTDPQALNKLVGESRVLRTIAVHIRPGHVGEFETLVKEVNEHAEGNPNTRPLLVSQAIEGGHGSTFYLTTFRSSLGGFDGSPTLKDILGQEGLAKFEKTISETTLGSESAIYRFSPELSNPPQEIVEVAADFWQPKPAMASAMKQKPKTVASGAETKPTAVHSKANAQQ